MHEGRRVRGETELVRSTRRPNQSLLREHQASTERFYASVEFKPESRVHIRMQQCHLGDRRDSDSIRRRNEPVHTAAARAAHRHHKSAQHAQDSAREYGYYDRAHRSRVSESSFALFAVVYSRLVLIVALD